MDKAINSKRYFGAGVSVDKWCTRGIGNWKLSIGRNAHLTFLEFDKLARRIQKVKNCLREIKMGIDYIRSHSEDPEWRPVDDSIFE